MCVSGVRITCILFVKVAFASDISDECDPTSGLDAVPIGTNVFKAFQDKLHNYPFQVGPWCMQVQWIYMWTYICICGCIYMWAYVYVGVYICEGTFASVHHFRSYAAIFPVLASPWVWGLSECCEGTQEGWKGLHSEPNKSVGQWRGGAQWYPNIHP